MPIIALAVTPRDTAWKLRYWVSVVLIFASRTIDLAMAVSHAEVLIYSATVTRSPVVR